MKPESLETILGGSDLTIPPGNEEIEISVFGPGYGESILVHPGENNWIIIDSCLEPETNEPAALDYLKRIDVNPADAVKQVIATHWHDDHMRGLASIVRTCINATFVCSDAVNSEEFLQLARVYGGGMMMQSYELRPGLKEMWEVLQVLKERHQKSSGKFTAKLAAADRDLWHCILGTPDSSRECRVRSLSPSDASILAAKLDLASQFVPGYMAPKRCLPSPSPNHTAVVIWIDVGKFSILLGSDLQETGDANSGWSAIILSDIRPTSKASFFKIPHHGSKNGHHRTVWKDMLEPKPITVLTPFELGNRRLPTKTDVRRLISLSDESYSAASFGKKPKKTRERMVEKTLQEIGITVRQKYTGFGHVRVRVDPAMQVRTELFGEALLLSKIYAV